MASSIQRERLAREQRRRAMLGRALSEREFDVLVLIHTGMQNKEIARALGLRHATVESHRMHLYAKLGVRNAVLAALAYERGQIPPIKMREAA